jgi:mannose-6-phosphate isomerase-like protein (cupin superfamily)
MGPRTGLDMMVNRQNLITAPAGTEHHSSNPQISLSVTEPFWLHRTDIIMHKHDNIIVSNGIFSLP